MHLRLLAGAWEDDLTVKKTSYSLRGPESGSEHQHPHLTGAYNTRSQGSVDLVPSYCFCGHCTHTHIDTYTQLKKVL